MSITIQEITDCEQWNAFLISQPRGHLLQSFEWGELNKYLFQYPQGGSKKGENSVQPSSALQASKVYTKKPKASSGSTLDERIYRLGALEDGRLIGAMQLTVAPVPLPASVPGVHLNWLYSVRGPTVERPDSPALGALIEYAHGLARREHTVVLRVEPNIADDDPNEHAWLAAYHKLGFQSNPIAIHGRRSWVLDIRPDAEQLLANFKMTWRQNVRSAERKGVTIREASGDADFDVYYELLKVTSERDDFFIHDKAYHKEIMHHFATKGDAVLFLAEHEGQAIAAKMLIRFGDWCWDMFGASANEKRNLKPTYLLQYRCFLWAKSKGCSYFDFRTIPEILEPGEEMWGVYEYKKGYDGFSRLNMPTQDYVYRPVIYTAWRKMVEYRRTQRHKERKKVELERAARGKVSEQNTANTENVKSAK